MDVTYCVNGTYPISGEQPPGCYYNDRGDFIAILYDRNQTVPLVGKAFDYNSAGLPITNGPPVNGNITKIRIPPNGWTELYLNNTCGGDSGIRIEGSSNLVDVDQSVSCMKIGPSESWNDYVLSCQLGTANQEECQQYAKKSPVPPEKNDSSSRWWIYFLIGLIMFFIVLLVLVGIYRSNYTSKQTIEVESPTIQPNLDSPSSKRSDIDIKSPKVSRNSGSAPSREEIQVNDESVRVFDRNRYYKIE